MDTCQQCAKPLPPAREPWRQPPRRFCGARCRARAWRQRREREVREALAAAAVALEKTRAVLKSRGKP